MKLKPIATAVCLCVVCTLVTVACESKPTSDAEEEANRVSAEQLRAPAVIDGTSQLPDSDSLTFNLRSDTPVFTLVEGGVTSAPTPTSAGTDVPSTTSPYVESEIEDSNEVVIPEGQAYPNTGMFLEDD